MPKAQAAQTDAIDRTVGWQVRFLRTQKGVSRLSLATALGISQQQLQKSEAGENRFSAGRLHEISRVLNVPVSDLFKGVGEAPPQAAVSKTRSLTPVSVEAALFLASYLEIASEGKRKAVAALVFALAAAAEPDPRETVDPNCQSPVE